MRILFHSPVQSKQRQLTEAKKGQQWPIQVSIVQQRWAPGPCWASQDRWLDTIPPARLAPPLRPGQSQEPPAGETFRRCLSWRRSAKGDGHFTEFRVLKECTHTQPSFCHHTVSSVIPPLRPSTYYRFFFFFLTRNSLFMKEKPSILEWLLPFLPFSSCVSHSLFDKRDCAVFSMACTQILSALQIYSHCNDRLSQQWTFVFLVPLPVHECVHVCVNAGGYWQCFKFKAGIVLRKIGFQGKFHWGSRRLQDPLAGSRGRVPL